MIRVLIFDKDGTLVKFSDIWARAAKNLISKMTENPEDLRSLEEKIGLGEDGTIIKDSPLAIGTNKDVADALGISEGEINGAFASYLAKNEDMIRPTEDMRETIKGLKDKGIKIGLVTADSKALALKQLEILGIAEYFDFVIGYDSGFEPKPSSQCLGFVEKEYGVKREEIAYVGDTKTDIEFGSNTGTMFGYRSEVSPDTIEEDVDIMLDSLKDISKCI